MQNCSIEQKDSGVFLANEQKTKWVTIITVITMVVEIAVGYWSGSMALLADGWHMASHSLALSLSLIVYYLYRHPRFKASFTFGGGKILSLGGYTSAIFLVMIAGSMIVESIHRFSQVHAIHYPEAIAVAVLGLMVNLVCAWILHDSGQGHSHGHNHGHGHDDHANCSHPVNKLSPPKAIVDQHGHGHSHDHNHQSAYMHVVTDAVTSVLAIGALLMGQWLGLSWLDPAVGLLGGFLVLKWSVELIRQSGMDLLDAHDASINQENLIKAIESDGSSVVDIHLWRLAPGQVGCELIVRRNLEQRSAYYRDLIQQEFSIHHLVIEVV